MQGQVGLLPVEKAYYLYGLWPQALKVGGFRSPQNWEAVVQSGGAIDNSVHPRPLSALK